MNQKSQSPIKPELTQNQQHSILLKTPNKKPFFTPIYIYSYSDACTSFFDLFAEAKPVLNHDTNHCHSQELGIVIQTKTSGIPVRIFVTDSGQTPVSREKCCVTPPCSLPQPREHESMICHFCSLMLFLCCSGEPRSHLVFDRVTFCSCLSFYLEGNRCIFDLHFSIVQFSDSGTL